MKIYVSYPKVYCDPVATCNGNGVCEDDGSCKCNEKRFQGATCFGMFLQISFQYTVMRFWKHSIGNLWSKPMGIHNSIL